MKNTLILFFISVLSLGCENDPVNKPDQINPLPDAELTLGGTLNHLPVDILSTEPTVVFMNSSGQENRFTIEYRREVDDRTVSGIPYTAENLRSDYHEVNPGGVFYLSISANIEYNPQKQISEFLGANLTTSYNNGFIPFLTIDNLGNISFGSTHDEVEIAGRTFQNVFSNFILPNDFTSFTKIYYTKDKGIVGYEGIDREMWALDRFEN